MNKVLYYPYINLPKVDWTLRTLLYYETVSSIVPHEYFDFPKKNYEPFMLELVQSELVIPIDPYDVLDKFSEISKTFLEFLSGKDYQFKKKAKEFETKKFSGARIHSEKFDHELYYQLEQRKLAKKGDGMWFIVEDSTANYLMKFLSSVISGKLNLQPITDRYTSISSKVEKKRDIKREIILNDLIPCPQDINIKKLKKFKDKYPGLLNSFKNRIEGLVFDDSIKEESQLFKIRIEELKIRKDELHAKMGESQFKNILFGSVCGVVGTIPGIITANTAVTVIGGLSSFASAVYTALKIEKPEKIFDQSGMKYLALVEKRLLK
jgi:hypothetical protein